MQANRRTRQSASYVEQRRKRIIWGLAFLIAVIIIGVSVLSWFTKLQTFQITSVRIDGADPDIATDLRNATESAISGSYFYLFPKANILIYPSGAVARAVKEASGRVDTVETSLNDLHQISVTITEKTPSALACPDFPNLDTTSANGSAGSSNDQCYFVDKNGLIYSAAPDITGNIYHRYYIPEASGVNTSSASTSDSGTLIGGYATSSDEFTHLQTFYTEAQAAGLEVESILVKEKGEYEMYILNPDKSIAIIYINDSRPLSDELSNLLSFWTYMVTDATSTKTKPSFDYIDVRYGTNVFYRVNGGATSSNLSK